MSHFKDFCSTEGSDKAFLVIFDEENGGVGYARLNEDGKPVKWSFGETILAVEDMLRGVDPDITVVFYDDDPARASLRECNTWQEICDVLNREDCEKKSRLELIMEARKGWFRRFIRKDDDGKWFVKSRDGVSD